MFHEALEFLNGRESRKFSRNTYYERIDTDTVGVRLHKTLIIKIRRGDTIELNTGGWNTWTTRQRINKVLKQYFNNASVFTTNFEMYYREPMRQAIEFFDGMIIDFEGRCVNYWSRD